ncbi:urease accessory protein UreD [Nocardia stercoris]|uniref:Urease accessory protein n=1 Tax=Nocardia stercoris TaxID=2483361 RepID=A0A3M2L4U9_9NOCA|nr:urease accessory protein UreD [Nocardia stercoris]RMI32404.1 urease accessory protein [Nocardia stercoris]
MRTEVHIAARAGELPRIRATGGLAARHTAPGTVHLIGTAATPLGGDEISVTVTVGSGAGLVLRSVAATLALPGRGTPISVSHWTFEVAAGGRLDVDPEPLVVAGGAEHHAHNVIRVDADARLRVRERVQIGRFGEDHGCWHGSLRADLGRDPLLRHALDVGAPADDLLGAPRALVSELRYPDDAPAATTGLDAAVLPLALGGSLRTWTGALLPA